MSASFPAALFLAHCFLSFVAPTSLEVSQLFEAWCTQHGKTYSSLEEKFYRRDVFLDNYKYVAKHNKGDSYSLTMNAFADLTNREFVRTRLGLSSWLYFPSNHSNVEMPFVATGDIPSSIDWRTEGAVTQVKDQGNCGACWSFSATGAVEGINQIVTGSLVSLSEQELIDCDKSSNAGCEGGLMDYAFQFIVDNNGIDTENDYPYKAQDTTCSKEKLKRHVVTIDGYADVPQNNENMLLQAVATQPVSVGICGSERSFQLYSKGIFTGPCSTSLDHAVLIVGYGSDNGKDYWIVKNSWGTGWGMNGYVHMQRNTGSPEGICGINMLASYPVKTGANPPPSPSPKPQKCDIFTSCESGETCCCSSRIFGICISWSCCELESAVCCKDRRHCCPRDYPVCDVDNNRCLKHQGNTTTMATMKKSRSAGKTGGIWVSFLAVFLE